MYGSQQEAECIDLESFTGKDISGLVDKKYQRYQDPVLLLGKHLSQRLCDARGLGYAEYSTSSEKAENRSTQEYSDCFKDRFPEFKPHRPTKRLFRGATAAASYADSVF